MASMLSFNLRPPLLCSSSSSIRASRSSSIQLAPFNEIHSSLRLSSSYSFSGSPLILPNNQISTTLMAPTQSRTQTLILFAAKGYKLKTHKASAKRFRVTGKGKIMKRRAGKQHLLAEKNTERKFRLSNMIPISRSNYNNVIGCMPYLKVNRQAT